MLREPNVQMQQAELMIDNPLVLNVLMHLIEHEQYTFIGNGEELWLENLNHPSVQIIYLNDKNRLNEARSSYLAEKFVIVKRNLRRAYMMLRLKGLVINFTEFDGAAADYFHKISLIHVQAETELDKQAIAAYFPSFNEFELELDVRTLARKMADKTHAQVLRMMAQATEKPKLPFVTSIYSGLLVLFFLYLMWRQTYWPTNFVGIHYGATFNPLIISGEIWRLFASSAIHLDPMHLLFNVMFIYRFGKILESIFEGPRMIAIILISAGFGGLFNFAFSTSFAIGASGVAYGFIGAFIFAGFERRKALMPLVKRFLVPIFGGAAVMAFLIPNIDHFGHLGGLIGGFLAAATVGLPKLKAFWMRSALVVATSFVLISGLWVRGVRLTDTTDFASMNRAIIAKYYELGDEDRAKRLLERLEVGNFFEQGGQD